MNLSISKIETLGLVDGPGIRVVVFLNGCQLRCKYCHNPEMWKLGDYNYTPETLVNHILKYQNYFKNNGGVTFSGGEPLLQGEALKSTLKLLKEKNIHTALDTSFGCYSKYITEILEYTDLLILDIKGIDEYSYKDMTGIDMSTSLKLIDISNNMNKEMWIRTVIVPGINDNEEYISKLYDYLKIIKNIKKVELLPYHTMGISKYDELNIDYPLKNINDMDISECKRLENILKNKLGL